MSQLLKCRGLTKLKQRCKRTVEHEGLYCWQHEERENEKKESSKCKPNRNIPKPSVKTVKCSVEGCRYSLFKGSTCRIHSCSQSECAEPVIRGGIWCSAHKCQNEKCGYKKVAKKLACSVHACKAENCTNTKDENDRYCQSHLCSIKKCKKICNTENNGRKYCLDHKKQYALEKPEECPVCLEELKEEEPWPCGHYIHRSCITQGLKAECPLCRAKIELLPEEERIINARSNQMREENNQQMASRLANEMLIHEMRLRFGANYMQILQYVMARV